MFSSQKLGESVNMDFNLLPKLKKIFFQCWDTLEPACQLRRKGQ